MTQSGTALLSATEALRAEGAIVEHAVCAIDWTADAKPLLAAAGVELRSVLTFDSLCESWGEKR